MNDVALHPEATPEADVVRWRHHGASCVLPDGRLVAWPQGLSAAGVIDVVAEPGALVLRLDPARSWDQDGAQVRDVLSSVLVDPNSVFEAESPFGEGAGSAPDVRADAATERPDDVVIAAQAADVVSAVAAEVAHSHGGDIHLVDVVDGVVTVRLKGACDGCPAAAMTLHRRIESELRSRVSGVREVRAQSVERHAGGLQRGGRALLQWAHERRR